MRYFNRMMGDDNDLRETTGLDERMLYAVLCYVPLLVIIPLLVRRNDPFLNFHIRQGLVIVAGFVIALIAAWWLSAVGSGLFLILVIGDVVALVMALQGRKWKIPLLGYLAGLFRL